MSTNRIQRYEHVWKPKQSAPGPLPVGFVACSLNHLSAAERAAVAAQASLYQWAYERAREEAEERFIHDWII